jgi:hypothetical protein
MSAAGGCVNSFADKKSTLKREKGWERRSVHLLQLLLLTCCFFLNYDLFNNNNNNNNNK